MNIYSSLLYADTSFFKGMAHSLDLGSTMTMYNDYSNSGITDCDTLAHDWRVVGEEIRQAMQSYEQ